MRFLNWEGARHRPGGAWKVLIQVGSVAAALWVLWIGALSTVSGNAALSYVFESGLVPYLSYAESFQAEAGGTGGRTFRPSTGKQYEAGIKFQPAGSDLLISAAVYDLTRQNIVSTSTLDSVPARTGPVVSNSSPGTLRVPLSLSVAAPQRPPRQARAA